MTRVFVGVAFMVVALCAGIATQASFDAEKQSAPPHVAPTDRVGFSGPNLDEVKVSDDLAAIDTWNEGVRRENERIEAAAVDAYLADVARSRTTSSNASGPITRAPTTSNPGCDGFPAWFPHAIIWRESNCTRGINTGNGYYSAYQIAGFHWFGGACDGLTWTIPADEDECAWRLSRGGTNFAPWGG